MRGNCKLLHTMLVALLGCGSTEPRLRSPAGDWALTHVDGLAIPSLRADSGRLHLRVDGTMITVLAYQYVGLPLVDSIGGDWMWRADSVVLWYNLGTNFAIRRIALYTQEHELRLLFGTTTYRYAR